MMLNVGAIYIFLLCNQLWAVSPNYKDYVEYVTQFGKLLNLSKLLNLATRLKVDSTIREYIVTSPLWRMGFPVRRLFVVAVALYYVYMGVCKVSPILNDSLHGEFVSYFKGM